MACSVALAVANHARAASFALAGRSRVGGGGAFLDGFIAPCDSSPVAYACGIMHRVYRARAPVGTARDRRESRMSSRIVLALFAVGASLPVWAAPAPVPLPRDEECPAGYQVSTAYCLPMDGARYALPRAGKGKAKAKSLCPAAYQPSGDFCLASGASSRIAVVRKKDCPSGYVTEDAYCVASTDNARRLVAYAGVCPAGYLSSGEYCLATSENSRPAFVRNGLCPSGYTASGDYCLGAADAAPGQCPGGYLARGGRCVAIWNSRKSATLRVGPTCPSGQISSGDYCIAVK
jgi:hypothetical protein